MTIPTLSVDELRGRLRKALASAQHGLSENEINAALNGVARMLASNQPQLDQIFVAETVSSQSATIHCQKIEIKRLLNDKHELVKENESLKFELSKRSRKSTRPQASTEPSEESERKLIRLLKRRVAFLTKCVLRLGGWENDPPMTPDELEEHGLRLFGIGEWHTSEQELARLLGVRDLHSVYKNSQGKVHYKMPEFFKALRLIKSRDDLPYFSSGMSRRKVRLDRCRN